MINLLRTPKPPPRRGGLVTVTPVTAVAILTPLMALAAVGGALAFARSIVAQVPASSYRVESTPTPLDIAPEASAIAFDADGRLVVAFRLGSIWVRDEAPLGWRRFASGLFWPLGILPGQRGEMFVAQVPELTRIVDTDGDGVADLYETICDRWGLSGNYHEFLAGPVRDAEGNFFIALGCASSGGPLRPPTRGALHQWPSQLHGHHSPVPYRGWIVRIAPDGSMDPFATGFRQANGLCFNAAGALFAVDNQGDWVGTSPLHHVTRGAFCGHPAGLNWDPDIQGDPFGLPIEVLAARRKLPAVQIPQDDMAGSTAQPILDDTGGRFGPYEGQLFVAEWTHPRMHRVFLEEVAGEYQGACFPFLEEGGLRRGSNRLAFAPDGSLHIAQVSRLWGGAGEGLQRVVFTGKAPMDILEMRLGASGFELVFTKPVDGRAAAQASSWPLKRYRYLYHPEYGSPKVEVIPVPVTGVTVSQDGMRAHLEVERLVPERIYELRPRGIEARDGEPLATRLAAYTLNRLRP